MVRGVIIGFICYATYALSDLFVKFIGDSLPSVEVLSLGAVLMLTAVPFLKRPEDRWSDLLIARHQGIWVLRALCGAIASLSSVIAFKKLSMAEAFCLIFLMPIFVTILSVFILHEKVRWRRWSAVFIGFMGVLIVMRPGVRHLGLGHVAGLVCSIGSAITVIALRATGDGEKRITLYGAGVLGPMVVGGIFMLPDFIGPTWQQWLMISGYGVFAGLAAVLLMISTRLAPVSVIAPTQYSQMLWAIAFGYLFFNDHLDWPMVVGIVLILGAGLFTLIREHQVSNWWKRMKWLHLP